MKNIRSIITDLNVARSNDCSLEKSKEIKSIINDLLPYAEVEENLGISLDFYFKVMNSNWIFYCDGADTETKKPINISLLSVLRYDPREQVFVAKYKGHDFEVKLKPSLFNKQTLCGWALTESEVKGQ